MPSLPHELPRLRSFKRDGVPAGMMADDPWWHGIEPAVLLDAVSSDKCRLETRIRSAWDTTHWHILFEVDDDLVWATYRSREEPLWEEEVVEVFLDPVGDLESYFEIEINPLGTVKDLVLRRTRNGWRKDFAWSVEGLRSAVAQTASGWTARLSIPFAALGVNPPEADHVWRANFLRIDRPKGPRTDADLSAWSPTGMRQFHRAERFGFVEFS